MRLSTCCLILRKICSRFANWNNNAFGTTKFRLWEHCLQGKALTKWEIVKANYPTDADKMSACFTEAIQFYLERVAGVKYLGDFIIRILRTNKKPVLVLIKDYIARRNKLDRHLVGPYLRHNLALLTLHKKTKKYLTISWSSINSNMLRQMKRSRRMKLSLKPFWGVSIHPMWPVVSTQRS